MPDKVLIIDRQTWIRGGRVKSHTDFSALLNDKDNMCCLGFDAIACGFTPTEIRGRATPLSLYFEAHKPDCNVSQHADYFADRIDLTGAFLDDNKLVKQAININDNWRIDDAEREQSLKPVLMQIGGYTDIQFIN